MLSEVLRILGDWIRRIWTGQAPKDAGTPPRASPLASPREPGKPDDVRPSSPTPVDDPAKEAPAPGPSPRTARKTPPEPNSPTDSDQTAGGRVEDKEEDQSGDAAPGEPDVPARTREVHAPATPANVSQDEGNSTEATGDTDEGRDPARPPRKIRGRRSGSSTAAPPPAADRTGRGAKKPVRRRHRPELICRQPPGAAPWEIVLTTDEDPPPDAVEQSGKPLETVNRGEWRLSRFTGQISVSFRDGDSIDVPLFNRRPMIFKLSNDWTGDGRQVRAMTKGHFIVIAPCERMRERDRHQFGEPEGCSDTRFAAHFFFRDGSESDEDTGSLAGHKVALTASGFELDGDSLFDDSGEGTSSSASHRCSRLRKASSGPVSARSGRTAGPRSSSQPRQSLPTCWPAVRDACSSASTMRRACSTAVNSAT